jgi:GH24 family phage-related lysozyme (muramidase)
MIERFEGFVPYQYNDGTGTMTIGYGTTSADVSPLPTHLTQPAAQELLRERLARKYEPAVNGLSVPLNQNQFDALMSLVYNCGPGAMQWQIGQDLRARNYAAAANDFCRYVYAGGRILEGLVVRRAAERRLFLTPDGTHDDPYAQFADRIFRFSRESVASIPPVLNTFVGETLALNERDTVREHDRLNRAPAQNAALLKRHKLWLLVLRKRVWHVAHDPLGSDGRPTWSTAHRGSRWQQLHQRTAGL